MSEKNKQGSILEIVRRDVLLSTPGQYEISDEQLHFPYLYESENGTWYMTYREGPHMEEFFGPGNRVQCIQSRDQGKTWLPWMGLTPEHELYQFFITRLKDGSLISYQMRFEDMRQVDDSTTEGTAVLLRSIDEGATWTKQRALVTNMPYTVTVKAGAVTNVPYAIGEHLVSLWGPALEMDDGRLLWSVISREGNSLAGVVESTDGGQSWKFLASLCEDETVGERREPGLVELASGELLAVLRTGLIHDSIRHLRAELKAKMSLPAEHDKTTPELERKLDIEAKKMPNPVMVQVRSPDGGKTWSEPVKLDNPGASPQLLLLDNGVLVCVYGTRRGVYVMASWDGTGNSWSEPLQIYQGQTSGYTNVQALGKDRFKIVYAEGTFDAYQKGGNYIVRVEIAAAP